MLIESTDSGKALRFTVAAVMAFLFDFKVEHFIVQENCQLWMLHCTCRVVEFWKQRAGTMNTFNCSYLPLTGMYLGRSAISCEMRSHVWEISVHGQSFITYVDLQHKQAFQEK